MKLGSITVEQLSEGNFEVTQSGSITRSNPTAKQNDYSALVGIDPLVIIDGEDITLVDAGIGLGLDAKGHTEKLSNLRTNLGVFGIDYLHVKHVVLSHLHYDHMAGLSLTDSTQTTASTLPNATVYVHRKEWDYALEQIGSTQGLGIGYDLDDFYRLVADGKVVFLEDDYTRITDHVEAIRTGGHTPGHMIIRVSDGSEIGYYFGDLVPSEVFLHAGV
jgi:glyoxylase-like metal-dependent hydrolase (beta-lactamase superfamily II)